MSDTKPQFALRNDSLALRHRCEFAAELLRRIGARRVLDIGCGTGAHLTAPLAAALPEVQFLGVDEHEPSLARGRELYGALGNLKFATNAPDGARYDAIIASEVLEHVQDPVEFLTYMRAMLSPNGRVLLTVPNGCGWYEWAKVVESSLELSGIFSLMRRLKGKVRGEAGQPYSLAESPHVNFFSFGELQRLAAACGLAREDYRARMAVFDFVTGRVIDKVSRLGEWNVALARHLPPPLVADWMLVLAPQPLPRTPPVYQRGWYSRSLGRLAAATARCRLARQ
jgi:SAM-dependent methyltransferase